MLEELKRFLMFIRPAFSRQATYCWFVVVFVGLILRTDTFGVSSIIRALALEPQTYPCLLHFFHSTAWGIETIMPIWWRWLVQQNVAYRVADRLVMLGDHTKTPKDGRKMPAVTTLHQDSETGSKPSYFRGHHWGCISLLYQKATGQINTFGGDGMPLGLDSTEDYGPHTKLKMESGDVLLLLTDGFIE